MGQIMNIVIISYIYPKKINPSQGIYIHQQAKYLARLGNNVDVITTKSYGDNERESRDNVTIHRVSVHKGACTKEFHKLDPKSSGFGFIKNSLKKLIELNRKKGIDFIIGQFLGISTITIGVFAKLIGKKFIVISHGTGWELPKKSKIRNFLIRLALSVPDKIVCVSKKTKELLGYNANANKLIVIHNGMDPEYLSPSKSKGQFKKQLKIGNSQVILSVSNLIGKKGLDTIIRAISSLAKKCPNIIYLIVGEGVDREKLENIVKELSIEKFVRLEGKKVGSELANYYNICDMFVLMSRDVEEGIESFGIVYIEAAYFGKPVIAGASGGTKDAIIDGKTGFLMNTNDEKALEEKMLLLLKNKKLREKLGKAGRERVLKEFLWKHNAKKLLELCNGI